MRQIFYSGGAQQTRCCKGSECYKTSWPPRGSNSKETPHVSPDERAALQGGIGPCA